MSTNSGNNIGNGGIKGSSDVVPSSPSTVGYRKKSISGDSNNNTGGMIELIQKHWKGRNEFLKAQVQVIVVILLARIGNEWEPSYPRNDNHNVTMFWAMNAVLVIAAITTLKHDVNGSARGIQLLSRHQTEEWKGWMQWAFIMYHYYRAYYVYNEIRVFVSAYVWMTGFGNFLYFDKKHDFSIERAISMWLRINYFPLLLSVFVGVNFDLFYIVPLHTTAFFITMFTCYFANKILPESYSHTKRNGIALTALIVAHVIFYETPLVNFLLLFGKEIHFRFQSDKYSAAIGVVSGYFWSRFKQFLNWCHIPSNTDGTFTREQQMAAYGQRILGISLMVVWYIVFGSINDKFIYNPIHPYIFWIPIAGWLMVRNSSKYLTELHSTALEFFGRITLETYVLQFHLFMCKNVQHIPIVLPNSGPNGNFIMKFCNMIFCGIIFVATAWWARKITVSTQTTVTDLLVLVRKGPSNTDEDTNNNDNNQEEMKSLTKDSNREIPDIPTLDNDGRPKKLQNKQSDVV